jgi:glycosyltransferase involved in cell wall biosynthesis
VSVILPIRNEEMFIEESLNSLLEQDYDTGHCEIIVIDDHSNDRSSEIVQRYVDRDLPIRLLANTKTGTASARNKALETSRGEIVVNFSAHATATNSFLNTLVTKLLGSGPSIAGVGCRHETPSSDPLLSRIIGLALSTYLGGLGSTYSQPLSERYVTSTSFTAYRREIFKAIGTFDETLEPMGEDLDFNLRLREKGYRILFTPDALVYHHKDRSLSRFIRRMYLYGAARAIITTKRIRSFSLIHVGPSMLVMSLVV